MKCIHTYLFILLLSGCENVEKQGLIDIAEKIVEQYPDSVYQLLKDSRVSDWATEKDKADFALVFTESLYKSRIPVTSDSLIQIAWKYYSNQNGKIEAAKSNFYMGKLYSDLDSVTKATKYMIDAEIHASNTQQYKLLGLIESELGKLYLKQYQVEQALQHYRKSKAYFSQVFDDSNENYTTGNIARCFFYMDQKDSAMHYYKEAQKRAIERDDKDYVIYLSQDLIPFYVRIGQIQAARNLTEDVYALDSNKVHYICNLSDCVYFDNKLDSARYYWEMLLHDTLLDLSLKQKVALYLNLRNLEGQVGDYKKAYTNSLQYQKLSDSLQACFEQDCILQMEKKYRNEQLRNQNYVLYMNNSRKIFIISILLGVFILLLVVLVFFLIHHRKIVKKSGDTIYEYTALIDVLKEEHQTSQHNLFEKLNDKTEKEQRLKVTLLKRLEIIRRLTDLLAQCGNNEKAYHTFVKKIKELMSMNTLTQDILADLLDIVNMNYYGIVDFLRTEYNLSKEELELCSFICSGFTRPEMSVIYGISQNNIDVRCSRLKQQMGLKSPLTPFLKATIEQLKQKYS